MEEVGRAFKVTSFMEFSAEIKKTTPSPRVTRILVPGKDRVM